MFLVYEYFVMGWEFRTGNYHKNVRIGKRTIKDGEAV